jgi:hypothetical protein
MKMKLEKRALDKIYKRRDRYEIPDWQREKVWDLKRKQQLIDSILRGWKLPKLYFLKLDTAGQYEVVDGQQRLMTIFDFQSNKLQLSEESAEEFGGATYNELPEDISDAFDDFELDYDEIEDASDEEIKEFFQRLQVGLSLNSSEKLNSIHSKLRDFCRKTSEHSFFTSKTKISRKRYAHFDVVAKSMAIELEGLSTHLRYDVLKRVFEGNRTFSPSSAVAKRMRTALAFLESAIVDPAQLRNRSFVQSLINLACRLVEAKAEKGNEKVFGDFVQSFANDLTKQVELGQEATDFELIRFQSTVNANLKSGPLVRHRLLVRRLLEQVPTLLDEVDSTFVAQSGLKEEIKELAEDIVALTAQINEAYAAKEGGALFKPTTKTVTAQTAIGKQVNKLADYKTFVGNLYFLFWEGPGAKLKDQQPQSFLDIRDLRTDLQHDVDHGSEADAAKKKKKLGSAFTKYAGVSSPEAAGTHRFPLAHANILRAVRADLKVMAAKYA